MKQKAIFALLLFAAVQCFGQWAYTRTAMLTNAWTVPWPFVLIQETNVNADPVLLTDEVLTAVTNPPTGYASSVQIRPDAPLSLETQFYWTNSTADVSVSKPTLAFVLSIDNTNWGTANPVLVQFKRGNLRVASGTARTVTVIPWEELNGARYIKLLGFSPGDWYQPYGLGVTQNMHYGFFLTNIYVGQWSTGR